MRYIRPSNGFGFYVLTEKEALEKNFTGGYPLVGNLLLSREPTVVEMWEVCPLPGNYDPAVPQGWLDDRRYRGWNPAGVVWYYAPGDHFGTPLRIFDELWPTFRDILLARLVHEGEESNV